MTRHSAQYQPTNPFQALSDVYRYGFNGKELDPQGMGGGGSTYDYGFRIYNSGISKFLSVDPLNKVYPSYSSYQFAANTPIAAIDLDGLESKIIIQETQSDGSTTIKSTSDYTVETVKVDSYETDDYGITIYTGGEYTIDHRGPLGEGTYTVTLHPDGTFTENWEPAEGNSVNPFNSTGVSQARWIDGNQNDAKAMFTSRLNGRLIESMTEDMIFGIEYKKLPLITTQDQVTSLHSQIEQDVVVYETDDANFKGKFAGFATDEAASSYTAEWDSRSPSGPHASNQAKNSPEYGDSNVVMSFYDGAKNSTDNITSYIGLIKEGWFDHSEESLKCLVGDCNLSLDNAKAVKSYQEK